MAGEVCGVPGSVVGTTAVAPVGGDDCGAGGGGLGPGVGPGGVGCWPAAAAPIAADEMRMAMRWIDLMDAPG